MWILFTVVSYWGRGSELRGLYLQLLAAGGGVVNYMDSIHSCKLLGGEGWIMVFYTKVKGY